MYVLQQLEVATKVGKFTLGQSSSCDKHLGIKNNAQLLCIALSTYLWSMPTSL